MIIIAHRGVHSTTVPPNSPQALAVAMGDGYGLETDLRDLDGGICISHDIPSHNAPKLESLFSISADYPTACLALNIKSDGLGPSLKAMIDQYGLRNYFTFDMSVPQMLEYANLGICFFTRISEYEPLPVLYQQASGVWVDAFSEENWITLELLQSFVRDGKDICIVSPELHNRYNQPLWNKLEVWEREVPKLMLCTDYPERANIRFNHKKKGDI